MALATLQNVVIDALEDIKGQNILVFDAQPLTSMFDRVVIVSGTSNRQTRALAKNLHDKVKQAGGQVYGAEGEETGEWVLVDLGDIIVHIMQPSIREYYRLEEIWGKHPIDWQAEQKAANEKAAPRRKPTAKKPISAKKSPAKKSAAKKSKK
ncbi:MAG: ribosome silencing factor [Burkholderiaceae bacterium]|nr:ribosome silencing factor [Burkholderiaceae bacterium]